MKSLPVSPLLRRCKFLRNSLLSGRRLASVALLAAACGALPSVQAATVTLTVGDAGGTTSFNAAGHWSNNAAPTAGNDYLNTIGGTAGFILRTPPAAGPFTFAGSSLTLGDGPANLGVLLYKGTGPATDVITINNLTANNANISSGQASSTFTLAGTMTVGTGGVTFITNGDGNGAARTIIVNSAISGPGPVTVNSLTAVYGSTIFNGANTYTGGTTISANGTLRLTQLAALPGYGDGGTPTAVNVGAGGTLALFVGGPNDFTAAAIDRVRNNAVFASGSFLGFDTTNAPATGFTYSSNISGSIGFAKTGNNTLFLTGTNTYTGGTRIFGGTLSFTGLNNFGSGAINLAGGILLYAPGNTTDITAATTVSLSGASGIDTNGNNVTFTSPITGTTGALTKYGAGSLTLNSTLTTTTFFARLGQTTLSGANASLANTTFASVGQLNGDNAVLTVKDGAKLSVATDFNIADISSCVGTLFIADAAAAGTSVSTRSLYVGKSGTDTGAVVQTGGTMQSVAGATDWRIGGAGTPDNGAFGTYDIGGSSTFTTTSNFQTGAYGYGQMTITGSAAVSAAGYPVIGRFPGGHGTLNVTGGSFTQPNTANFIIVGESGQGTLNVSGTGVVNASNGQQLRLGNLTAGSPGVGIVNLGTGGSILAKAVNTADAAATSQFNFHGGTLQAMATGTSFMAGLTSAYVYGEGGTINSNGNDITVNQPLLAPDLDGVLSLPVLTGGAGYVGNPIITIADPGTGGGVGASAVPVIAGGVLTAVNIVNPGIGYQSVNSLTITIGGGNPTTPATLGTPTLGASASGRLTKTGTGALTLGGVNTYAGGTTVSAGSLVAGVAGALGTAGNLSLAADTTLDVSALAGGFTLDAGRTLTSAGATVTGQLNVSGTYQSTGASTLGGGLTVNAGGVVTAAGGTLTLQGAVTNNGTIRTSGGAGLNATGTTSFVNNGLIDLIAGSAQLPANFSNGANGVVITSNDVRVTSVTKSNASGVTVKINGLTGYSYQLQRSATLGATANYVNVGSPQNGANGAALTFTDPAPTGNQAFYRVQLSR